MKAVGIPATCSSHGVDALVDLEIAPPVPAARDLLVRVEAVSVNPLDTKMRAAKPHPDGRARILGWDAAGVVVASGADAHMFKAGDQVYYAGSIGRPGSNAQLQLVDERIVGRLPKSLGFAHAAALPLASLAAWEALFERMRVSSTGHDADKTLLIIGGAGGVGSMAIQLARALGRLRVVATASRPQSAAWCKELGAELVIDHGSALAPQLADAGIRELDYILCLSRPDAYFSAMAKLIKPHGHICALVDSAAPLPLNELRSKSASFSWEGMFTRSMYNTPDMVEQHNILNRVAALFDGGRLRPTAQCFFDGINADNLRQAHALLEGGNVIGKVVLSAQPAGA
jgi:NADPH2:quinone reductase